MGRAWRGPAGRRRLTPAAGTLGQPAESGRLAPSWTPDPVPRLPLRPGLSFQSPPLRAASNHWEPSSPPFLSPSSGHPGRDGAQRRQGQGGWSPPAAPNQGPPNTPSPLCPYQVLVLKGPSTSPAVLPCHQVLKSPSLQGQPPPGELLWVELCPQKRYGEVLTPMTCKCDLIWK